MLSSHESCTDTANVKLPFLLLLFCLSLSCYLLDSLDVISSIQFETLRSRVPLQGIIWTLVNMIPFTIAGLWLKNTFGISNGFDTRFEFTYDGGFPLKH